MGFSNILVKKAIAIKAKWKKGHGCKKKTMHIGQDALAD
jgi:hypothetical protein